jgi:hypothetical protein
MRTFCQKMVDQSLGLSLAGYASFRSPVKPANRNWSAYGLDNLASEDDFDAVARLAR